MDINRSAHTEVIMDIQIQLHQRLVRDEPEVNIDEGAGFNIHPLRSYHHLLSQQLTTDGLPKLAAVKQAIIRHESCTDGLPKWYGTKYCS